jgi:hypothetical protein
MTKIFKGMWMNIKAFKLKGIKQVLFFEANLEKTNSDRCMKSCIGSYRTILFPTPAGLKP